MTRKTSNVKFMFKALHPILYVSEVSVTRIPETEITPELIGEKAFGLSCLPQAWTLPFIVISHQLFSSYIKLKNKDRIKLLQRWEQQILAASITAGIDQQNQVIVRSSGCSEGLEQRGKFYSVQGSLQNIIKPLDECLEKLASDHDLRQHDIPLVIQRFLIPISARGHLSNERRVYKEKRDWLGQYEGVERKSIRPFQINLRNWRSKVPVSQQIESALSCILSAQVSETLRIPASWAYEQQLRLHFEWAWDGATIYLVQADRERLLDGVDPTKVFRPGRHISPTFTPKCLQIINSSHAAQYEKIRNVFTYIELGLPIKKLYVIDSQQIINDLSNGVVCSDLKSDLFELVKGSLVIRMDVATDDQDLRQLLPRTNEVRKLQDALDWLIDQSAMIKSSKIIDNIVFIFHNFIPALASAFAYAAPSERKVQIEALWGLPEGLYYNAHDKYVVDTKESRPEHLSVENITDFVVHSKPNYKRFFITPDEFGRWVSQALKDPFDWRSVIQNEDWIKEIAFESRRIAEREGKPISIMWFVGVDNTVCDRPVFPWFHEIYDQNITSRAQNLRTKTPFDRSLVIETSADINQLQLEACYPKSNVRRIKIQPREEELLRDKDTLKKIGELAIKINAIILLEGGVLSHAYYQLMHTKAIVEVVHPFSEFDDKREFNKLVRDKIPSNIEDKGEIARSTILFGEFLLRALREKLIEEAFEVLDAIDQDSIVGELADLNEVIDGILSQLGLCRDDLEKRQIKKRDKAGGFKNGIVLLETKNPMPLHKLKDSSSTLFHISDQSKAEFSITTTIDPREVIELGHSIDKKWNDRRVHPGATETILNLRVPLVRDGWSASTPSTEFDTSTGSVIRAKITGKREGSKLKVDLSLFFSQKQLTLW